MTVEYRIIPYADYLKGVAPLRARDEDNWIDAPLHDNPSAIFQYYGRELFEKVITFPVGAFMDDEPVGYTTIYNISDETLRFGGIYVEPEARGHRIGIGMCDFGLSLWPKEWHRLIGYYRSDSFIRFSQSWGMREFPEHYWRTVRLPNGVLRPHKVILTIRERT
jgi:GNAT superfamily N-acetyltransferase